MATAEFPASTTAPRFHRACPVCGDDAPRRLKHNRLAPLDGFDLSYAVARCGACGFHYASELPPPAVYDAYYRSLSKYDLTPENDDLPPPLRDRARQALALCRPHLPAGAVVTDIGCGSGALLLAFRDAGHRRLYGIDPAPAAAQRAIGDGADCRVVAGSLRQAATLPLGDSDLVCLTGIAEHLPRLREDLGWLCAQLPARARVLIEVPALETFPGSADEVFEPYGELSLEHLQYFDANALERLLADLGWRPLALAIEPNTGGTASLFGLFERGTPIREVSPTAEAARRRFDAYLLGSARRQQEVLQRIAATGTGAFLIHGAGSHTARLLPDLADAGQIGRVVGIVDNNPNLHGKALGGFTVEPAATLAAHPGLTVLVSSFHAQEAIAGSLGHAHPLLRLYDRT